MYDKDESPNDYGRKMIHDFFFFNLRWPMILGPEVWKYKKTQWLCAEFDIPNNFYLPIF